MPTASKRTTQKPKTAHRPATADRLRSRKGLVRRLPVYLDSEILEEYMDAKGEADLLASSTSVSARTSDEARAAVAERLASAKAALEETTEYMVLRRPIVHYVDDDGVERTLKGRLAYEWVINQHPATPEQNAESQKEHGQDAPYNADTFAPAIISACLEEPEMTPEEVDELLGEWTLAEAMQIFSAAMEVCNASQVDTLGKGYGRTTGF